MHLVPRVLQQPVQRVHVDAVARDGLRGEVVVVPAASCVGEVSGREILWMARGNCRGGCSETC